MGQQGNHVKFSLRGGKMQFYRTFWEQSTFRTKLIVVFLPMALVPMVSLTLFSSWIYSKQIETTTDNYLNNTIRLVNHHLQTYLNELTRLSLLPYYNENILSIMQQEGKLSYEDFAKMKSLLSEAIRNPREDLQSVFIYRRDGQIFSNSIYDADINYDYPFQSSEWYQKAVAANGRVVFTDKGYDSRIINRPQPAFSVARSIKVYNGPPLGVIIIDVNFTGLESIFERVHLGQGANLVILDENNEVIYAKNDFYLEDLPESAGWTENKQVVNVENDRLIVHHVDSEQTGWKIVGMVSEKEVNREKNIVYQTVLMFSAFILLAVVIVSVLLSSTITKPLTTLRQLMRKVENGDFNVSYQTLRGNIEISLVGRAFNKMNEKIEELIHQVLESRIKQKEAELRNLKLQVRPHFLYNNLEAIRALAEIGDKKGIADITSALGGMLRYSLNNQHTYVTLADEIQQTKNYLKIEQIRSGHELQFQFDLDEKLLRCYTIPFLLQPVVENCIIHGFAQVMKEKYISIVLQEEKDDNSIIIMISDNGAGMSEEKLAELNACLADENESLSFAQSGIGLKNLQSRLRLEYGSRYGLTVSGKSGKGLTVKIRIPKMMVPLPETMMERKGSDHAFARSGR